MNIKDFIIERENELKEVSKIRVNDNYKARTSDYRSDADVDYARILYSSSYRRLQGKMQLLIPKIEGLHRNRLTHSNEVAQIAKTIAKKLGLQDTLTVQTCSLAHDFGNPPFGHAGEIALTEASQSPYEGNAQTYRIVRWVEERHFGFNGLNLTLRTMLGLVKYYNTNETGSKKFLYYEDYSEVKKWLEKYNIKHKTIDCEIMDISDEIAYAAHDLEDALKQKYFTLEELLYEFSIHNTYKSVYSTFKDIAEEARDFASKASVYKTSEEYAMLLRKELTSKLVSAFVDDIGIKDGKVNYTYLKDLADGLKKLTFSAIKRQPDILEYEQQGKFILTSLFNLYMNDSFNKKLELLPANYRIPNSIDDPNSKIYKKKQILDYLGGMTDFYAIHTYEKYFGKLNGKDVFMRNYKTD